MATKTIVHENIARGTIRGTWATLAQGDDGTYYEAEQYHTKTVSVGGTFGGATLTLKGSNDDVNYFILHDPQGNDLTFTGATSRMERISESPKRIRPFVTGGDGTTAITVIIIGTTGKTAC